MKRFNLLNEISSIRNTVRPNTPDPTDKRKLPVSPFLLLLLFGVAFLVFDSYSGWHSASKQGRTKPLQTKKVVEDVVPPDIADKNVKERPPKKVIPAPSRPVAQKLVKEEAEKKAVRKKTWNLRFAICVYRESCESVGAQLKKEGVAAHVVEGHAKVGVYRIMVGPWPTSSHAEEIRLLLKSKGVEGGSFMADNHHYLLTVSTPQEKVATAMRDRIRKMGFRAEMAFKKELSKVYKVYSAGFPNEEAAKAEKKRLGGKGIDSVVEKRE